MQNHSWEEVIIEKDISTIFYNFHRTVLLICDKNFPEKTKTISKLDKKWITPELKTLSRKIKAESFRNRKKPLMEKPKEGRKKKKKKIH